MRGFILSDIIEKYSKIAHENCRRQLNTANSRIVEFEDIKKSHLVYVDKLKNQIKDLEKHSVYKHIEMKTYSYKHTSRKTYYWEILSCQFGPPFFSIKEASDWLAEKIKLPKT